MNKITYLFGAGASRHAVPIVNEIPDRIKKLIEFLESDHLKLDSNSSFEDLQLPSQKSKRDYQLDLISALKWMMNESQNHASIDTFAKKLFIKKNESELKILKIAMSVFFIFEQSFKKPDFRYDAFYASLLNNLFEFPDNVQIISWNYDYQFELSFSEYSDELDVSSNQNLLNVKTKFSKNTNDAGFGIYKLNGTTGFYYKDSFKEYPYLTNLKTPIDIDFISQVTRNYTEAKYSRLMKSSLSFAWEPERPELNFIEQVKESIKDTTTLVIIGYSFPFFNRNIDRNIIGSMEHLTSVYFQAPDAEIIKERFRAIKDNIIGIELISKFDVGQFLLPNEL